MKNIKSEKKLEAIRLWKNGLSVQMIAQKLSVTRQSIYRWVDELDVQLAQKAKRRRLSIDQMAKMRVIELFILLKRPSMRELSESLRFYFHISLSASQLRRYLEKWGMKDYRPSPLYESIKKDAMKFSIASRSSTDELQEMENFQSQTERSEHPSL